MNTITPTLIEIRFDELASSKDQLAELRVAISELAPARARKKQIARGGVETGIWIFLSYVGLKYLDAVFAEVALKHIEFVIERLKKIFPPEDEQYDFRQAVTLRLSAEEIDLEINLPIRAKVGFYENLLLKVSEHLQQKPLSERPIDRICIPMVDNGKDGWWETFFVTEADFDDRYWGIDSGGYIGDVYDSHTRALLDVDPQRIF